MSEQSPFYKSTLMPHLVVRDGAAAIDFYKKAFGAVEGCRLHIPGTQQVMHAGLRIGNSLFMLGCEADEEGCAAKSPLSLGGTPVALHLNVDNVDALFHQALAAGAEQILAPTDMFWGDRYGKVRDPFGHEWSIATTLQELTPEEMQANAEKFFSAQPQPVG